MDQLKLSQGLIAFGGIEGVGKTRFMLKLANYLAKREKVLYLSYQDYSEKLVTIVRNIDGIVYENLEVNTSMDYYGIGCFLEIIKHKKSKGFKTLIVDDIDSFNRNQFYEFDENGKDNAIEGLLYLANHLNIRIIFIIDVKSTFQYKIPRVRDFNWSRRMINDCSQILALYRPIYLGITEDENGKSSADLIEVYSLKNDNDEEEVIRLENHKLNIYSNEKRV